MKPYRVFIILLIANQAWPVNAAKAEPAPTARPKPQCKTGDWVEFEVRLAENITATNKKNQAESSGKTVISMRFRLTVLRMDKTSMDILLKTRYGSNIKSIMRRNLKITSLFKSIKSNPAIAPRELKHGTKIKLQIGKRQYTGIEQTWQTTTLTGKLKITRCLCRAIPFGLASLKTGNHSLRVVAFGNRDEQKKEPVFPHPNLPVKKAVLQPVPQPKQ